MLRKAHAFFVKYFSSSSQLLNSRHCRFLLLVSLLICSSLPFLSLNLPFSKLYEKYHKNSETLDLAKELNSIRLSKARSYFNSTDPRKSLTLYKLRSKKVSDVVICIVTVRRSNRYHETGYLVQTSSVIDSVIKSDVYFNNTLLFLCNVDTDPQGHTDALFVQQYIPFVQKYGTNSFGKSYHLSDFSSDHKNLARRKEIEDYIFCMNVSRSFGSKYVLMLEDDVVPYKNVFEVLHYTIKQHNLQHYDHLAKKVEEGREFAFLKLYYPERWQGYANEVDRIIELLSVSVLGGGIFLLFASICATKSGLNYCFKLLYFTFGAVMTLFSVLLIGRYNVMMLRRVSPQFFVFKPTPGCCTPAMFYSSHVLTGLMSHLMTHSTINKDLAINDFINKNNIPGYILEPNLFRHIGMYTSLQDAYKPPAEFIFDMP